MSAPTSSTGRHLTQKSFELQPGLSGKLWPIHPKPRPDELLSSWLIRFAHAHGIKAETVCTMLFKRYTPVWNRDIDRLAPDYLLEGLCRVTGATPEQAWNTTLPAYEGWLSERVNRHGNSRWILPLGVYHRERTRPSLLFCPQCLAEPDGRFYRRKWRLAWTTVCTKHGCLLLDQCPFCGAAIEPHRTDMTARRIFPNKDMLVSCHHCSKSLLRAPVTSADPSLIAFQRELEAILEAGYVDWAGNPNLYSVLYFNGLRSMLAGILTGRKVSKRDQQLAHLSGKEIERLALADRQMLMGKMASLLHEWPSAFKRYVSEFHIRCSDLTNSATAPPFWYASVMASFARRSTPFSENEAYAIYDAAYKQGKPTTNQALREFSGRDFSRQQGFNKRKHMTDEEYEQFMVDIDHRIAGTLNERKRLIYLRTKFMFAAARQFKLSQEKVILLTMDDVRQWVPEIPEASFYTEPRSKREAAAWMAWYWEKIRPRFRPNPGEKGVFTGFGTGRAISAVGAGVWLSNIGLKL